MSAIGEVSFTLHVQPVNVVCNLPVLVLISRMFEAFVPSGPEKFHGARQEPGSPEWFMAASTKTKEYNLEILNTMSFLPSI